jgi:hypothetical protein
MIDVHMVCSTVEDLHASRTPHIYFDDTAYQTFFESRSSEEREAFED